MCVPLRGTATAAAHRSLAVCTALEERERLWQRTTGRDAPAIDHRSHRGSPSGAPWLDLCVLEGRRRANESRFCFVRECKRGGAYIIFIYMCLCACVYVYKCVCVWECMSMCTASYSIIYSCTRLTTIMEVTQEQQEVQNGMPPEDASCAIRILVRSSTAN